MNTQMIQEMENRVEEPLVLGNDISAFESEDVLERSRKIPSFPNTVQHWQSKSYRHGMEPPLPGEERHSG